MELRDYGTKQELYVDGVFVLEKEGMDAREALEAVSEFSRELEFWPSELDPAGTASLFDGRSFSAIRPRTMARGA
ncbi:MAG: hypothetical protein AB1425_09735 [Actinomycetota bacterium]